MKNFKIFLITKLTVVLLLFYGSLNASSITSLEIKPGEQGKTFVLFLETEGRGTIDIKIFDENQKPVLSEEINSVTVFIKKFNLDNLENADYVLQIKDDFVTTLQPFNTQEGKLEIDYEARKIIRKLSVNFNEESHQLDIDWLVGIPKKRIHLKLVEEITGFTFEDTIKNKPRIRKRYNISKLPPGNYSLNLSCGDKSFFKTIQVK